MDITDEDRASIKAITEEYPAASRMLKMVFMLVDTLSDNEETQRATMIGFELGMRVAIAADRETVHQSIQLIHRGRDKVGNQETDALMDMLTQIVQVEVTHGDVRL